MSDLSEKKPITIYDIAEEAGVSASTVSRVLTNSANVRKEKRERIEAIIEKYNFKPNALAKGLSDTRSHLIGLIAADVRNPFYAAAYVACENAARELGYKMLLCNSLGEKDREIDQLHMLVQQRVDAIIQLGGRADDLSTDVAYADEVNRTANGVPFIVTGKMDGVNCYRVKIDAKEACTLLTEHLIQLGHKRIALVGGRQDVLSTREKYETYRSILDKHGIEFREEYVVNGGYNNETGYMGVKKLLGLKEIPTAIIAINDFSAAGIVRGLTELGFKIPGDISVVSYDNTYIADLMVPKLTSIDYDYEAFGMALVSTAVKVLDGEKVESLTPVIPHLVVRESSGAVKE